MQEVYLSKRLLDSTQPGGQSDSRQHAHFTLRAGVQVQSPRLSVPAAAAAPFAPAAAAEGSAGTAVSPVGEPKPFAIDNESG